MSIQRDERIRFHELGTLHSVTRWMSAHEEGIAEWLKNVRRAYQTDRANVSDEHRVAVILMKDAAGDNPARIGVLDVGGATLEDVTRWSEWQDFTASGRGSALSEEQTQGNGAKAYMYKLFNGRACILGIKDGKLNRKGFDGPIQSLERGTPGFIPNAASAQDLSIPTWKPQLVDALLPYDVRFEELPAQMRSAVESRRAFTLVEGIDPKDLYRGRINAIDLMTKLLRQDQVTAVIEQLRIYAVHNGRVLNEGRPLELEQIEPYRGFEQPRVFEVPESLRDSNGVVQSTTLGGTRPSGRLILYTSRENMPRAYKSLKPRWKISYRANPNHPIGSKPVSDLVPGVPGSYFVYGMIELSAFEPDYVALGRLRPNDGPLVSAVDLFVAESIRGLAKEINDQRRQALDEETLDEVQRENKILDKFKNEFLNAQGPGVLPPPIEPQLAPEHGQTAASIELRWDSKQSLRMGNGVMLHLGAILRPRVVDEDGRYVPTAEIDWYSADRHILEILEDERATASEKGRTEIWCRVRGTSIESERISVVVWIIDHVLLTPRTLEIPLGRREQITAQVTNDEGERATNVLLNWSHDAPDQLLVRITPWGFVTGNRLGQTSVSAGAGREGAGGVWARIRAEVTVVDNPKKEGGDNGFPRLLVTDSDVDPDTGETRPSNVDQPTLWQEVIDYQQNIWWLNLGSPEAAFFFRRRADNPTEWRAFHAQKVIEMVIQVHMKEEYSAREEGERPDLWLRHKAQLEIFQVQMMQAMWEKITPFIQTGEDLD